MAKLGMFAMAQLGILGMAQLGILGMAQLGIFAMAQLGISGMAHLSDAQWSDAKQVVLHQLRTILSDQSWTGASFTD